MCMPIPACSSHFKSHCDREQSARWGDPFATKLPQEQVPLNDRIASGQSSAGTFREPKNMQERPYHPRGLGGRGPRGGALGRPYTTKGVHTSRDRVFCQPEEQGMFYNFQHWLPSGAGRIWRGHQSARHIPSSRWSRTSSMPQPPSAFVLKSGGTCASSWI